MRTTLTHDFERIASTCYNISSKVHSSLYYTDSTLNWAFNETFWRLIYDLPYSLCYIPDEDVGVAQDINWSRYLIYLLEKLFTIELW